MEYQTVIDFWFNELEAKQWWVKDDQLDETIRSRFSSFHETAVTGELFKWRSEPEGRLAEVLILDQFSRNMFRNMPWAFAWDGMALVLAQEAVNCGADQALSSQQKAFLYMPYMHSESALIHQQAVILFNIPGLEQQYEFELKHKAIIDRFGRYPHRNELMGRESTPEELEFLKQPGSSF